MKRFDRVIEILDNAVGGSQSPAGVHGAFWRNQTIDEFTSLSIFGLDLIIVGDGSNSNLVKALRGQTPFGVDIGTQNASFNRMPPGIAPVADEDIAFIETWINDGCPDDDLNQSSVPQPSPTGPGEDPTPSEPDHDDDYADYQWRPTSLPNASGNGRTNDIWFEDELCGWAVNTDGFIYKTEDGGETWVTQAGFIDGTYGRCIGFANKNVGWVGTFNPNRRLLFTNNGGATWESVANLPGDQPSRICGISVVNQDVVYAAGTNDNRYPVGILKTVDGGSSWTAIDMSQYAANLIDIHFEDELRGWVVGGVDIVQHPDPTRSRSRGDLVPGIFRTLDGGMTWENKVSGSTYVTQNGRGGMFPQGEWCWKIQVIDSNTIVVCNQNYRDGAILRSDDAGETWQRLPINDRQRNSNLEGIGFLNPNHGWVGGWGDYNYFNGFTSETRDGGANWAESNHVGFRINRFRFIGSPPTVAYASGHTVYKFSKDPVPDGVLERHVADIQSARLLGRDSVKIPVNVPPQASELTVGIWNVDGDFLRLLVKEVSPSSGARKLIWDFKDDEGEEVSVSCYIANVITDSGLSSFVINRSSDD